MLKVTPEEKAIAWLAEIVSSSYKANFRNCGWCDFYIWKFSPQAALKGKFYHADKGSGLSCYENAWISRKTKGQSVI